MKANHNDNLVDVYKRQVVECTRSNVIFFLMLLRNVLLMRRCTFWNWTDSERIFFFSSSVSRKHFSEVLKKPSSPSSTMFPLARRSHNSSMQASNAAPITFLGRCWKVAICSTNSFWAVSYTHLYRGSGYGSAGDNSREPSSVGTYGKNHLQGQGQGNRHQHLSGYD